jgi:hypothetical protein
MLRLPHSAAVLLTVAIAAPSVARPAEEDNRLLRGIPDFSVEVSVGGTGPGDGATSASRPPPCRLDPEALERLGVEALRAAKLDALTAAEVTRRLAEPSRRRRGTGARGAQPGEAPVPGGQRRN